MKYARVSILAALAAGIGLLAVAASATTSKLREMPESYLLSGLPLPAPRVRGTLAPLRAGTTYKAAAFPIPIRATPTGSGWTGAQWKSARLGFREGGPPFFGWAAVGRGGTSYPSAPNGLVVVMTAYARTPSVAATVTNLRTRGHGVTYEATSRVRVAGFPAVQFDGLAAGQAQHVFVPFSPRQVNHFQDAYWVNDGEAFRIVVLDVRGKTVVIFIDSAGLPANQLPAFLPKANAIIESLRFPRSRS